MSPETLTLRLESAPTTARVVPGGLDALVKRCMAQARAEGERDASQRAAKAFEAAVVKLEASQAEAADALARNAVQLAVEIARTLVRVEIDAGRHGLEKIVRESLAASGVGRGAAQVHLHPADHALVADVRWRSGTVVEADDAVQRGDVHISTPQGLLVREIQDSLRAIHERLLGELA